MASQHIMVCLLLTAVSYHACLQLQAVMLADSQTKLAVYACQSASMSAHISVCISQHIRSNHILSHHITSHRITLHCCTSHCRVLPLSDGSRRQAVHLTICLPATDSRPDTAARPATAAAPDQAASAGSPAGKHRGRAATTAAAAARASSCCNAARCR